VNAYHSKFLNSYSAENIVGIFSRYKGSSKEITESWGMLEALCRKTKIHEDQLVIVVGDGSSPRTAALVSYFTRAEVISVDPAMNMDHWEEHKKKQSDMGFPVRRMIVLKARIEDLEIYAEGRPCTVIFPHSHANMLRVRLVDPGVIDYISMPCCKKIHPVLMELEHSIYTDQNILSPKNEIHLWYDLNPGFLLTKPPRNVDVQLVKPFTKK